MVAYSVRRSGSYAERNLFTTVVATPPSYSSWGNTFGFEKPTAFNTLEQGDMGSAVYGPGKVLVGIFNAEGLGKNLLGLRVGHRGVSGIWKWDVGDWLKEQGVRLE
jgi:hypothetical protein